VDWLLTFACAAYNLVRLRRLPPALAATRRRMRCTATATRGRGKKPHANRIPLITALPRGARTKITTYSHETRGFSALC
jgi:hypothetical protein